MRILNVNSILDPVTGGGTTERTCQLSRIMRKAGIECQILTTFIGKDPDVLRSMGDLKITVLPCLNSRFRIPKFTYRQILSIVSDYDIIHLMDHWTILNAIVCRAARQLNKPYVVCPAGALPIFGRSAVIKKLYNRLVGYKLIQGACNHVAITSAESYQFEPYGIDHSDVTVIPNGIDCNVEFERDDSLFRNKFGIGDNPFILFLGRLSLIKGPDLLLRAFLNVKNEIDNYHLVFAGPDGEVASELKEIVAGSGVAHKIHFIGYVGGVDKYQAYCASDVVVIPSRQEAMSLVALEAGAAGTPVILTDQCGFDELADSGGGIIVEATIDALQRGMLEMRDKREDLDDMGEKLKQYVSKSYSWDAVLDKYMTIYNKILRD